MGFRCQFVLVESQTQRISQFHSSGTYFYLFRKSVSVFSIIRNYKIRINIIYHGHVWRFININIIIIIIIVIVVVGVTRFTQSVPLYKLREGDMTERLRPIIISVNQTCCLLKKLVWMISYNNSLVTSLLSFFFGYLSQESAPIVTEASVNKLSSNVGACHTESRKKSVDCFTLANLSMRLESIFH